MRYSASNPRAAENFKALTDFRVETVQNFLRGLCKEKNLGHRMHNHFVQAIDSFCRWCVNTRRLIANPLVGLPRLNNEVDVRHKRRALMADEVGKLIAAARANPRRIQGYTGEQRARLYLLSYMTGLRKNEIASLTARSFDLASSPPTLTLEAKASKHRRKDTLPIHPELAAILGPMAR